jgi:hypothetical protein
MNLIIKFKQSLIIKFNHIFNLIFTIKCCLGLTIMFSDVK